MSEDTYYFPEEDVNLIQIYKRGSYEWRGDE